MTVDEFRDCKSRRAVATLWTAKGVVDSSTDSCVRARRAQTVAERFNSVDDDGSGELDMMN